MQTLCSLPYQTVSSFTSLLSHLSGSAYTCACLLISRKYTSVIPKKPKRKECNYKKSELEESMIQALCECTELDLQVLHQSLSDLARNQRADKERINIKDTFFTSAHLPTYRSHHSFFHNINGFPISAVHQQRYPGVSVSAGSSVRWFRSRARSQPSSGLGGAGAGAGGSAERDSLDQQADGSWASEVGGTQPAPQLPPPHMFDLRFGFPPPPPPAAASSPTQPAAATSTTGTTASAADVSHIRLAKDSANIEPNQRISKLLEESQSEAERTRLLSAMIEGFRSAGDGKKEKRFKGFFNNLVNGLIVAFLIYSLVIMLKDGGSFPGLSGSVFTEISPETINISFDDVKGCDEAKTELEDVVEYLKNPDKFTAIGGKLPKGVLLVGDPGTGKTLLARAVACEAGVPFFYAAGSEFDEIFVGMGGKRVRQLFKAAKAHAPSVIFIDEIDSVGGKRRQLEVNGRFANQTINQLLAEMDGFRQNEGVIVLGATNRRQDLDIALTRPGRFDVEVYVHKPDLKGRKEIIQLYIDKLQVAGDVDISALASRTVGFTGADLENLVNQGALRAALDQCDEVHMSHLYEAMDKVMMGPEKKSKIPDEETNRVTAVHEGGHTIVAYYTRASDPIHKVTIIQRGAALGHTAFTPEKDQYNLSKEQLLAQMDVLMGGRVAEELEFGANKVTTGAGDDLQKATRIASAMVKELGMSDKVGVRTIVDSGQLGMYNGRGGMGEVGPETQDIVDQEIRRVLQESYERAKSILRQHHKEHKTLVEALLQHETLDKNDLDLIVKGKALNKPT